jgi:hypothetical protein
MANIADDNIIPGRCRVQHLGPKEKVMRRARSIGQPMYDPAEDLLGSGSACKARQTAFLASPPPAL